MGDLRDWSNTTCKSANWIADSLLQDELGLFGSQKCWLVGRRKLRTLVTCRLREALLCFWIWDSDFVSLESFVVDLNVIWPFCCFQSSAGNIAVETLENGKASVLTVLMQLPADDDGFTPVGQSGICFASVLGTHGDAPGTTPAGRATRIRTRKRCNGTCV